MYRLRIKKEGPLWRLAVGGQTLGSYASLALAEAAAESNAAILRRHEYPCEIIVEPEPDLQPVAALRAE